MLMTITIYSTPTCVYCKAAKKFFIDHNLDYKEVDVAMDPAAAQDLIEKSGQLGVPVIIVNQDGKDTVLVGYNQSKLKQVLSVT